MQSAKKQFLAATATAAMLLIANSPARAQAGGQTGPPPSPGKWGRMAPLPEKSEEFTFADVNGKIYLFGGLPVGSSPPLGLVQEYDPATDQWTKKKNMPLATHHAAVAAYNGKLYLFGGQAQLQPGGPTQVPLDNTWEYDPANDSWKALAPMPTARTAAVAAAVGGKLYVLGGASVHPGQKIVSLGPTVPHRSLDVNEVYDPQTNKWETRMTMPTARNHADFRTRKPKRPAAPDSPGPGAAAPIAAENRIPRGGAAACSFRSRVRTQRKPGNKPGAGAHANVSHDGGHRTHAPAGAGKRADPARTYSSAPGDQRTTRGLDCATRGRPVVDRRGGSRSAPRPVALRCRDRPLLAPNNCNQPVRASRPAQPQSDLRRRVDHTPDVVSREGRRRRCRARAPPGTRHCWNAPAHRRHRLAGEFGRGERRLGREPHDRLRARCGQRGGCNDRP